MTPAKLRQLMQDTEKRVNEIEEVLQATPVKTTPSADPPFSLWEVFAGEGRVTKTACRRKNMTARRFSLSKDWDFTKASHRVSFLRLLRKEEPDAVLLSPTCKLWSQLQELSVAPKPGYAEKLEEQRIWDHDNVLMFCAVVYEHQRRRGKIALCEHPKGSRTWSTQAFES